MADNMPSRALHTGDFPGARPRDGTAKARAWKRETSGKGRVSKGRAAIPPPWFPPLESSFRGAPITRYPQRGKPILLHREIEMPVEPLLGEWRAPRSPGHPGGARPLQLFISPSPTAQGRGRGGPLWPSGRGPAGLGASYRWPGISGPQGTRALKAPAGSSFPRPPMPQSRLRGRPSATPADLWPRCRSALGAIRHPSAPRGSPNLRKDE